MAVRGLAELNGIASVSKRLAWLLIAGWLTAVIWPAASLADDAADTRQQATWLLKKATLIHRDGRQNLLLRALRQMRDPKLAPLFSELVQRRHPGLKIHGILGLAELSDPPQLDMALVADLESPATQAQLVSAAIDNNLLSADDAAKLAEWPGLAPPVQVLVAGKLVAEGRAVDPTILNRAMASDNLALRGMAALLKIHLGDESARAVLADIHESDAVERDAVRKLVLQTAMRHELPAAGPWAMTILREEEPETDLWFQALRAALMFEDQAAAEQWRRRFDAAEGLPMRLRLAVLAIDIAEHVKPDLFIPLLQQADPLLSTIGQAGEAIASGEVGLRPTIELIRMNNVLTNRWAVKRAVTLSDGRTKPTAARPILLAIIDAADSDYLDTASERDKPRFAAQRLQNAIAAVQKLHENDPASHDAVAERLRDATMLQQEAILMGLIRSDGERPDKLLQRVDPELRSKTAEALAILLRAKHARHAEALGEAAMNRLSLIVRRAFPPGRGLEEPLRLQAGWSYLRLSRDAPLALAEVLGAESTP